MSNTGFTAAGNPVVKDTGLPSVVTASATVGSGLTKVLIPASTNVAGLLLHSLTMSSDAGGNPASNFQATDQVVDDSGNVYGAINIAMNMNGDAQNVGLPFDLEGTQVAAGENVTLENGGAGGTTALRQVTAVISFTVLA
jgi:hypothetical protein